MIIHMPPQYSDSAHKHETVIQSMLHTVANGEFRSIYHMYHELDLPESSLYDRQQVVKSRVEVCESQQNLTVAKECTLVKWVTKLTTTDYPTRYATVHKMAEEIRHQHVAPVNDTTIGYVQY